MVTLRPYVFVFLAAFLFISCHMIGWQRTRYFMAITWMAALICELSSTRFGIPLANYLGRATVSLLVLMAYPPLDQRLPQKAAPYPEPVGVYSARLRTLLRRSDLYSRGYILDQRATTRDDRDHDLYPDHHPSDSASVRKAAANLVQDLQK